MTAEKFREMRGSSDNEYLHKDFHGALCYAIKYLDETYGPQTTEEYLCRVGREVFSPLIEALRQEGLKALECHFRKVFELEEGIVEFIRENDRLVLKVEQCPAVAHLKKTGQFYTERFCESTVHVNRAVCGAAGYESRCEYEPGAGRCVQTFWKEESSA
jgi:hypothetical protein